LNKTLLKDEDEVGDENEMQLKPSFKVNIILLLAIFFGLAAAWGVRSYLLDIKEKYRAEGDFVKVVVAAKYIPRGTKITSKEISIKEIPKQYAHPSSATDVAEVIGKISTYEIFPGEQVIKERFCEKGETKYGLAYLVAEGERAVTVSVNKVSGIAGLVQPGDRVDVFTTINYDNEIQSNLLIQNVKVLAVDRSLEENVQSVNTSNSSYPETITLAVTPGQAQKIILASEAGSIRLALRSPTDKSIVKVPSEKLTYIIK